jgi:hypothetical protein
MAQQTINVGTSPNDGQGDPIRTAFIKCNDNFTELFSGSGGSNAISNGNSIVQISTANGNIRMSVSGTANVAVVTATGITVSNTVSAANLTSTGAVSATGNITGGNILTVGLISATGNVRGGNILTVGLISAPGNVTGNNINSTTTFGLAVFANATVRDSSIASPVAGMMIYVTGTGMQVRGATSWNTIAGSGT